MACDSPYIVKDKLRGDIPVPCGLCPPCQKRRVSQWAFRLKKQEEISYSALFVTLTFSTQHVPITSKGFMTLDKREFQMFMKRLRKIAYFNRKDGPKISYYCVGEYGSHTYRPHFHAIIFNAYSSEIEEAWQKGDIFIGKVSGASIAYTLKYINKGKRIPMHQNDDRVPEFSLMSKKMGSNYLTPETLKYHRNDLSKAYVTIEGGIKIAIPRYYRDQIYTEAERKKQALICEKVFIENDIRRRREYFNANGTLGGFERQVDSERKQRYIRHRKQGLENRKKI